MRAAKTGGAWKLALSNTAGQPTHYSIAVKHKRTVSRLELLLRDQLLDGLTILYLTFDQSMSFSFNQRVKLSEDVLISDLQGESVILNVNSQRYYGLDKVGTRFLTLLSSSETIEHAFEALLAEFDVDAVALRTDLTDLLVELSDQGLVEIWD